MQENYLFDYREEQKLVRYFKLIKLKNAAKYDCVIFLSERFFLLYSILLKKYPEIELDNYHMYNSEISYGEKLLYINDINYELPKKIGKKDRIATYFMIDFTDVINVLEIIPECNNYPAYGYIDRACFYYSDKKRKKHFHREKNEPAKKGKQTYILPATYKGGLDFLTKEINLFQEINISEPIALMPDFLRNYFDFTRNNSEHIFHYIQSEGLLNIFSPSHKKSFIEIQYEVCEKLKKEYGAENLSKEFIEFIAMYIEHSQFMYYSMFHTRLVKPDETAKVKKMEKK